MDRTETVPLAPSEPRCDPSRGCVMRSRCARAIAAIPARYAVIEDFSTAAHGGTALCGGYLDAAGLRKAAIKPPKPRVHPPIGSK